MSKIYSEATLVYVWLGEAIPEVDITEFSTTLVLDPAQYDSLSDAQHRKSWQALSKLMKREWFSRRWVVQELALAKRAILLYGEDFLAWAQFADAIAIFESFEKNRILSRMVQSDGSIAHMPNFFGGIDALGAVKLSRTTNHLFTTSAEGKRTALLTLEHLLSDLTHFEASKPHDIVYALLSMAKDTIPDVNIDKSFDASGLTDEQRRYLTGLNEKQKTMLQSIWSRLTQKSYPVEYQQSVSDVYVACVKFVVQQARETHSASALDFICRPWAPQPKINKYTSSPEYQRSTYLDSRRRESTETEHIRDSLPSWIRSVDGQTHAKGTIGDVEKMDRVNADPLVGISLRPYYSAAGNRPVTNSFHFDHGITRYNRNPKLVGTNYHSMYVEGFVLDYVDELGSLAASGMIPPDWAEIARCQERPDLDLLRDSHDWGAYWRTLVANRDQFGGNPARIYPRLIVHALKQGASGARLNLENIQLYGGSSIVSELLERIRSVIWDKKLARSEHEKFLMLLPEKAKEGDAICILYGCSVPVVLRRFDKTKQELEEERRQHMQRDSVKFAFTRTIKRFRQKRAQRHPTKDNQADSEAQAEGGAQGGSTYESPAQRPAIGARARSADTSAQLLRPPLPPTYGNPSMAQSATHIQAQTPGQDQLNINGKRVRSTVAVESSSTAKPNVSLSIPKGKASGFHLRTDQGVFYEFIGEAYVHSMMDGAAIELQAKRESATLEAREEAKKTPTSAAANRSRAASVSSSSGDWRPGLYSHRNASQERPTKRPRMEAEMPRMLLKLR